MCALAELLSRTGSVVSGCDLRPGPSVRSLRSLGIEVHEGHDPGHLQGAVVVVVSAAVPPDHPEVLEARNRGIPVIKRAQALGEWVGQGRVVAVAGTHGKTSTTAMVAQILAHAGLDPTGLVGGAVAAWGGNLRTGSGELYVVEADEYDRSFHTLAPDHAVVTNVEADHLDTYGSLAEVREAFRVFVHSVAEHGRVAICADDHGASRLLPETGDRGYSYGLSAGAQLRGARVRLNGVGSRFTVAEDGRARGDVTLPAPGLHNVRNALGAAAVARSLEVGWTSIVRGLAGFSGVARRFQQLGESRGVLMVDDYAHHPTEVKATLTAAREAFPERRLVAVFQPHLYTRTRDFAVEVEFGQALAKADEVWVTDVYPAREKPLPGISGALVASAAEGSGARNVRYHADLESLAEALARELRRGDLCLTLGAGSVEHLGPAVLEVLKGDRNG
jgi:UDP-N-acetylmuramate--alanine ligase